MQKEGIRLLTNYGILVPKEIEDVLAGSPRGSREVAKKKAEEERVIREIENLGRDQLPRTISYAGRAQTMLLDGSVVQNGGPSRSGSMARELWSHEKRTEDMLDAAPGEIESAARILEEESLAESPMQRITRARGRHAAQLLKRIGENVHQEYGIVGQHTAAGPRLQDANTEVINELRNSSPGLLKELDETLDTEMIIPEEEGVTKDEHAAVKNKAPCRCKNQRSALRLIAARIRSSALNDTERRKLVKAWYYEVTNCSTIQDAKGRMVQDLNRVCFSHLKFITGKMGLRTRTLNAEASNRWLNVLYHKPRE